MHATPLFKLFALLAFVAAPISAGVLRRQADPAKRDELPTEDEKNICRPTPEGTCTLAVTSSLIVVPTFDSDNMWAGANEDRSQAVLNPHCQYFAIKNDVEAAGGGNGFDGDIQVQGWVEPIKFHADSIGQGFTRGIEFIIKGRTYTDCDCEDYASGLSGNTACRCEFDCHDVKDE